jgi:hypothetical protein
LQRRPGRDHGGDLLAARSGGAHRQATDLAAADRVDDAHVGDRRHEQLVERRHRRLEVARAVGDLADRRENGEALAVAVGALAVAGGEHRDDRDRHADRHPLDVDAVAEVVVPEAAQRDEHRRDRADDADVARVAVQAADERREHDEPDEDERRADRDVEHREQACDRQAGGQRERTSAACGRTDRWHEAIIGRSRGSLRVLTQGSEPLGDPGGVGRRPAWR